jgi:aspartyl-tRNA synthetase
MAFVTEDDVIAVMERVMDAVFALTGFEVGGPPPWPRMTYAEAMDRFGSDRPDRRFGLELRDVSDALRGSEFKVFESVLGGGGAVKALNAGRRELSRSELDGLNDVVRRHGGKAVAWAHVEGGGGWRSPIAKFFSVDQLAAASGVLEAGEGDLLLFVADRPRVAAEALGGLRLELGRRFGLIAEDRHDAHWIVDFPMFDPTDDGGLTAVHHPFTAPRGDLSEPATALSRGYDLVVDGMELGGGSIRINIPEVQQQVFEIIGLDEEEARARFGFLLEALRYGAPPHGGIAMGLDRIVAVMAGRESIRDVIPFPKTATGQDPLTGAPAPVDAKQLRELGVAPLVRPS